MAKGIFKDVYFLHPNERVKLEEFGLAHLRPVRKRLEDTGVLKVKGASIVLDIQLAYDKHQPITFAWIGQNRFYGLPEVIIAKRRDTIGLPTREGSWVSESLERAPARQPTQIQLVNTNSNVPFAYAGREDLVVKLSRPQDISWQLRNGQLLYTPQNIGL